MKRVYVAGRLSDPAIDYIRNIHRMMQWADEIRKLGCSVYVPCLDLLMGIFVGHYCYDDYFDNSQPWLDAANAVFLVPGWETSDGTNRERRRAAKQHIPIFTKLEDLKNWLSTQ